MNFLPPNIEKYSDQHTSPESDLLNELERQTYIKILQPRMLSGHLQGRFLSMISKMIKPEHILEIGTYTGYSALCLAEGLDNNGTLTTIEIDPEIAEFADSYFQRSKYKNHIDLKVGNALEIIPVLSPKYDLVFIDADKTNYLNYLDLIFSKLNMGGYLIADNVLWSGKVAVPVDSKDLDTQILIEFNHKIHNDSRWENILLPIRDGLMMARKK
jgi:predicted O-methyltransferase YrrM